MTPLRGSRAIWSEFVPYGELCSPRVLDLLRSRSLGVQVAVTPELTGKVSGVVRACRDAGIRVGLWPLLARQDGRWPNGTNVGTFQTFVADLLEALGRAGALPDELAIDLEPSIDDLGPLLRLDPVVIARRLTQGMERSATRRYVELVGAIHRRGITTLAAAFPLVLSDGRATGGWQQLLGTPVDGPPFSQVTVMVYSSVVEGYARGLLDRADTVSLLAAAASAAVRRYGVRASLSLGATGTGALGDEPLYRDRDELAEDVAIARAAGVDHLVLFSLGGVLGRSHPEAWLDALVATEPARRLPGLRPRAAVAAAVSCGVSRAVGWGHRLARRRR